MTKFIEAAVRFFKDFFNWPVKRDDGEMMLPVQRDFFAKLKNEIRGLGFKSVRVKVYENGSFTLGFATTYWIYVEVPKGMNVLSALVSTAFLVKRQWVGEKLGGFFEVSYEKPDKAELLIRVPERCLWAIGLERWRKNCVFFFRNLEA